MTKVAQIEDRGAAVAWSPIGSHADVIALGAKDSGSIGFDDYGGELELFNLGFTSASQIPNVIGSIKTTSRFSSIGWTTGTSSLSSIMSMGIIAGGMADGTVNVYNPSAIISGGEASSSALLASIERKNGAICALKFNPHPASANLLATGSGNGEILITSLDDPTKPTVTVPSSSSNGSGAIDGAANQGAGITQLAWNTEVSHIVAAGAGNGICTIWDLRQNKPWCELRCEASGAPVADLTWNPVNGMHLLTASSDDRNPVLKLWDLRASSSMPLATMQGHTGGILSMDWCPHDESLLLSCGKESKTILWDIHSLKPIAEVPNYGEEQLSSSAQESIQTPAELYTANSGLTSSQQKRYDVKWSPLRKGVMSTCSFDRKVQIHSVLGIATKSGRPPKWMKPASGVSCGFGGSVISFGTTHKIVNIASHVEEPELKEAVLEFESAIAGGDYNAFSAMKAINAAKAGNDYERELWGFMQILFSGSNPRHNLLNYLGFEPEDIAQKANEFKDDEVDVDISALSLDQNANAASKLPMSKKAEDVVNKALMIGNFEAAVECCVRSNNLADALVLASCGGAELWAKTQARYFASEIGKRPFLSVVSAVMHNKLDEFVTSSDPKTWDETLAILCTYSSEERFAPLCELLGDHLTNAGDAANASLCYLCALNLGKASKYWQDQLNRETEQFNFEGQKYLALHSFVEKVAVFMQAVPSNDELAEDVGELLFQYAKVISEQGLFPLAAKYCRSTSKECMELSDRLYRSKDTSLCTQVLGSTPDFPYTYVNVGVAPAVPESTSSMTRHLPNQHQPTPVNLPKQARDVSKTRQANSATHVGAGHVNDGAQTRNSMNARGYNKNTHATSYDTSQGSQVGSATSGMNGQYGRDTNQTPSKQIQPTDASLPTGWTALHDPSSGRTYYANSTTGETTWDRPVSQTPIAVSTPHRNTSTLASKYGDGFVSSASHPELGAQYGNVGTSNPYTDSARPGTALISKVEKPPVSGTFNPKKLAEVADNTQYKPMLDDLLLIVESFSANSIGPSEKRQLAEAQKATAIFSKRLAQGDIPADVANKLGEIVVALKSNNMTAANGIHTSLVNSVWKEHKDWLKGIKFLIQMTAKSSQGSRSRNQW